MALDVNGLVHGVVRDCGIVHGESEKIPFSPSEIRPGVMDDGSGAVRLDVLSEPFSPVHSVAVELKDASILPRPPRRRWAADGV